MAHYVGCDYEEALRLYEEGLTLDPNSVLCLWQSGVTLGRMRRFEESLAQFGRAVDLSQRGALMVAFQQRALTLLGRGHGARALLDELHQRASKEYIGEAAWLGAALASSDVTEAESAIRLNIEAGTGPTSLAIWVDRELDALLPHPRLGPLVRQLSLYSGRA